MTLAGCSGTAHEGVSSGPAWAVSETKQANRAALGELVVE